MKNFFVITAFIFGIHVNAQDYLLGSTVSYQSQAGNILKLGGYYVQPFACNTMGLKVEANAQLAYFRNQFLAIPEGSLTYYPTFNRLIVPFIETEITPYTLTPKVGLSVATIVEIGLGYGFDIKTKENLKPIKGFSFSVGFNIPLNAF